MYFADLNGVDMMLVGMRDGGMLMGRCTPILMGTIQCMKIDVPIEDADIELPDKQSFVSTVIVPWGNVAWIVPQEARQAGHALRAEKIWNDWCDRPMNGISKSVSDDVITAVLGEG